MVNVEYHSKSVFDWEGLPVEENIIDRLNYKNFMIITSLFFQIKKCGKMDCNICKPIRSDDLDFSQVHSLPPIADKTRYKQFSDVYGTITTEQHRPSLSNQRKRKENSVLLVNLLEMLE